MIILAIVTYAGFIQGMTIPAYVFVLAFLADAALLDRVFDNE